jgi:hydrogenase large subunit
MTRKVIGPFNRVEGDLEVKIDIADGRVADSWVTSPLYRGFEQILHGRDPLDALVYAPRICGICSVSQSVAAVLALAELQQVETPPNGALARNIILAAENVADHLTHFYLFFMPDFCRATYAAEPWHPAAAERFTAIKGSAARDMLPARAEFMHILGLLAGKWPHTLALQPGGTTRAVEAQEQMRLIFLLAGFRRFLEQRLYGTALERIAGLASVEDLATYRTEAPATSADFRHFLAIAEALQLDRLGRAADRFLSYGNYWQDGAPHFARGLFQADALTAFDAADIAEDVSHSWMSGGDGPLHPFQGMTLPNPDNAAGYTWCKAPRLAGQVVEVGALARQAVDGQKLIRDLLRQGGGSVTARVVARLVEIARIVLAMESWAKRLTPKEPFCATVEMPPEGAAFGLVEAARGSLGHWIRLKHGRILNYQIVAPTTWNFSPRDAAGQRGALEMALIGAPVRPGESDPVSVQHVVRSFDPCMVCTVH